MQEGKDGETWVSQHLAKKDLTTTEVARLT